MDLEKHIARLLRAAGEVVVGVGLLIVLITGAEAQEEVRQAPRTLRITRAVLDAAGGTVNGSKNLRVRSSLGSGLQTGLLKGRLRLTSGFVQRPRAHPALDLLKGDFNGDSRVDFDDFFLFAVAFGSRDVRFDLNGDGQVDFDDFFVFAVQFGKKR